MNESQKAIQLIDWILERINKGLPVLSSAGELARKYETDPALKTADARVSALIRRESAKNFASGFITGFGGLLSFPVSIPSALAASWVFQGRMAAAVAALYGHDIKSNHTRTFVLLSLMEFTAPDVLYAAGVEFSGDWRNLDFDKLTDAQLEEIRKEVGKRLLVKAGRRTVVNFLKFVPVIGGVATGGFDGYLCSQVGNTARSIFAA